MDGSPHFPSHLFDDEPHGINPLPGIDSLSVSDEDLALPFQQPHSSSSQKLEQQLYGEAAAARESATQADIEAAGIIPDIDKIAAALSRPLDDAADQHRAAPHEAATKVYRDATFAEFAQDYKDRFSQLNDLADSDEDPDFELEWSAAFAGIDVDDFDHHLLQEYRRKARTTSRKLKAAAAKFDLLRQTQKEPISVQKFDLIGSLSTCTELAVELGTHLPLKDIVKLYSISRDFHDAIDAYMQSSVMAWVRHKAPQAASLFRTAAYQKYYIPDPAGRYRDKPVHDMSYITYPERISCPDTSTEVRLVPGLRWLQLVCHREIRTRDIIATMARHGHRLPSGTSMTLMKLWLIMDIPVSISRAEAIAKPSFFSNEDLVRSQLFFTKLDMLFNDPLVGPSSSTLSSLMLGQRSLSTLWAFLRRKAYTTKLEVRQLKLRYDVGVAPDILAYGQPLDGVHLHEMGVGHFEGWGVGSLHLIRPDELVPMEAARRQLELDMFARQYMMYGHVNMSMGSSLVPTLDEMYMSDEELPDNEKHISPVNRGCGNVPFDRHMWQPKHARKACWETLTQDEKNLIIAEEKREIDQEWALDHADAELAKAVDVLKRVIEPFLGECCRTSDRKGRLTEAGLDDGKGPDMIAIASTADSTDSNEDSDFEMEEGEEEDDNEPREELPTFRFPSLSPEYFNTWLGNRSSGSRVLGRIVEEDEEGEEGEEGEEETRTVIIGTRNQPESEGGPEFLPIQDLEDNPEEPALLDLIGVGDGPDGSDNDEDGGSGGDFIDIDSQTVENSDSDSGYSEGGDSDGSSSEGSGSENTTGLEMQDTSAVTEPDIAQTEDPHEPEGSNAKRNRTPSSEL